LKEALAKSVAKAGNKATNLAATIKTVNELGTELTRVAGLRVLAQAPGATAAEKEDFNIAFSNILQDIAKSAKNSPEVRKAYGDFLQKDPKQKDGFARDDKGNFVALAASVTAYLGSTLSTVPGPALAQLDQLSTSMSDFAVTIMGGKNGKSLKDIYNILDKSKAPTTITNEQINAAIKENQGSSSGYLKNPESRFTKEES
jgi:hypothetical protein